MLAVHVLNLAICLRLRWAEPPPMYIFINGKLSVEGNLNAFTNPAIEAGLVHCRALLEFLGLRMTSQVRTGNVKKRRSRDIGIESFVNANGHQLMIDPAAAFERYPGGPAEAENAFHAVFLITNKGLAHVTEDLMENPQHGRLIETPYTYRS